MNIDPTLLGVMGVKSHRVALLSSVVLGVVQWLICTLLLFMPPLIHAPTYLKFSII